MVKNTLRHQTLLGVGQSPKLLVLVGLTIRGDEGFVCLPYEGHTDIRGVQVESCDGATSSIMVEEGPLILEAWCL